MISSARGTVVRLKSEWMGYPIGYVLSLPTSIARGLFQRDVAEIATPLNKEIVQQRLKRRSKLNEA
jgi:hypothetical protein